MKKTIFIWIFVVLILLVGFYFFHQSSREENIEDYLKSDYYYDLDNLKTVVSRFQGPPSQVADEIVRWVYENIHYDFTEPDDVCLRSRASDVLIRGTGQCDTMSRLAVALLRAKGIPAKVKVGCVAQSSMCQIMQPIPTPIITPIKYNPAKKAYSRGGGLHSWVSAYIDGKWVDYEVTTGTRINPCYRYVEEKPAQSIFDECVSTNVYFVNYCRKL